MRGGARGVEEDLAVIVQSGVFRSVRDTDGRGEREHDMQGGLGDGDGSREAHGAQAPAHERGRDGPRQGGDADQDGGARCRAATDRVRHGGKQNGDRGSRRAAERAQLACAHA